MARLPPPCHSLYCRLRLFDRRTRRHPPLRTTFLLAALGICHSRRLPTQRRRRSDPNDTSPTRSQQSEGASSSRSPRPCRDVLAAIGRSGRRREFLITDAARLGAPRHHNGRIPIPPGIARVVKCRATLSHERGSSIGRIIAQYPQAVHHSPPIFS